MNTTTKQAPDAAAKAAFLQRASNNFMLTQITISVWSGVAMNKSGAAKAARGAGAGESVGRLYVDMLGTHQRELKNVTARYAELRTYLYANTLPFSTAGEGQQRKGDRLVATLRVPEVLANLTKMAREASNALEAFLVDYDRFVSYAKAHDLGEWGALNYPSAAEVRSKFSAHIEPPRPLAIPDAAQMSSLPADLAAEIAAQHSMQATRMLEGAKAAALEGALAHMEKVNTQLRDGKRLHQSLVDLAREHAQMLSDIATGTDNDPRLTELAKVIRAQVTNVNDVTRWNDRPDLREQAATAATVTVKALRALAKDHASPAAPSAAATGTGDVVIGGVLADLW